MRQTSRIAALLVIFAALVAASCPPQRIAYTSIDQAVTGVQTALQAWNEGYYQPGVKVDPAKWNARRDQLATAYAKFQKAALTATTVAQDLSQKDTATKIASDAAADFIALVASLEK